VTAASAARASAMRVAIVGAGYSGTMAAVEAKRACPSAEVSLVEKRGRFAAGAAYSTASGSHLLNVRARSMSAFADSPDDFADWLEREGLGGPATFARRRDFARYLAGMLDRAEIRRVEGRGRRGRGRLWCSRRASDCRSTRLCSRAAIIRGALPAAARDRDGGRSLGTGRGRVDRPAGGAGRRPASARHRPHHGRRRAVARRFGLSGPDGRGVAARAGAAPARGAAFAAAGGGAAGAARRADPACARGWSRGGRRSIRFGRIRSPCGAASPRPSRSGSFATPAPGGTSTAIASRLRWRRGSPRFGIRAGSRCWPGGSGRRARRSRSPAGRRRGSAAIRGGNQLHRAGRRDRPGRGPARPTPAGERPGAAGPARRRARRRRGLAPGRGRRSAVAPPVRDRAADPRRLLGDRGGARHPPSGAGRRPRARLLGERD
jgi:hypothetical protein